MAPTVNINHTSERDRRPKGGERRSDLVCRVKYSNTLPDIPFDPKFINYPFSANRYVGYKPTSLEKNYRHEVLTELDLGVGIDLINADAYTSIPGAELHPDDEKLLEDDVLLPQDAKRSRHNHVNVSWLRRTEYISTETTRYQPQTMEKIEATVGFAARKKAQKATEVTYTDRDSQLIAIENTFVQVKKPETMHYSKPGVVAVEELPLYPDFDLWKHPCAQVIFDSDPAPVGRSMPAQMEEMSQAMIRGVMDESGEQFVAYFLPTEETLVKRAKDREMEIEYAEEEDYHYLLAREYNWNVKNKASKGYEENFFLVMRPDGVYYNELETRVRLSKRRIKQGHPTNNSRLVVTHRSLNAVEYKMQRNREKMLEPPYDEEEEEDEAADQDDEGAMESGDNEGDESGDNEDRGDESGDNDDRGDESGDNDDRGDESGDNDDRGDESGDNDDRGDESGDNDNRGDRSGDESRAADSEDDKDGRDTEKNYSGDDSAGDFGATDSGENDDDGDSGSDSGRDNGSGKDSDDDETMKED